ncbi:MAG: disulfide bond formation protein B [Actinomycetia bacterium]|nr:disulfide bond formation protein B [Actinomycetes bacterium]MCP3913343.1 disulfide bond formation protein B [Actinomycetes bacterium]
MDTDTMSRLFAVLALIANAGTLAGFVVLVVGRFMPSPPALIVRARRQLAELAPGLASIVAIVASLGSLYLSEIANFVPCRLCWFQRIGMYPLAVILTLATLRGDRIIRIYAAPFAVVGLGISSWHWLIQKYPSLDSGSCELSAPCTQRWIWEWDFVSIPWMAGSSFLAILVLLIAWSPVQAAEHS